MTPLRAEDLRHRIEIRRPTETKDGKGGWTTSWPVIALPWAEVIGLDGRESVMDQVLEGVSVYRIRIRWRAGILVKDQVRHGAVTLNITSAVDPDGKREQLVIMASTAAALKAG
ncbi:phage head closure protein [Sphingomonas hengshuiensis]|uniref:Head-tail adaptor protein n=1 Tax=Sphingomonas hengshuiensis TaxID=1609977 RepID=A0A7U4J9X7_9SPHN|nr:phage head closure protein [Sphingomonas hengshuiensis]AJP72931.1 hypothetical protein TS85_15725 [Sphingomonas hengshuiensis]